MSNLRGASGKLPSEDDLIRTVAEYREGIDAQTLVEALAKKGFSPRGVRSALRKSLDKGTIALGRKLRIYLPDLAA